MTATQNSDQDEISGQQKQKLSIPFSFQDSPSYKAEVMNATRSNLAKRKAKILHMRVSVFILCMYLIKFEEMVIAPIVILALWFLVEVISLPTVEKNDQENEAKIIKILQSSDPERATQQFRKLAEKGNHFSAYELAKAYESGEGVERDEAQALDWYKRAAGRGNPDAQYVLGRAYLECRFGFAKNTEKAVEWLGRAAHNGNPDAQRILDEIFREMG